MVEGLEVMSVEDSRVMDVNLSRTFTEGVQSTSRTWKRRAPLAVAPVLGVVFVAAVIFQGQGDSVGTPPLVVGAKSSLKGDLEAVTSGTLFLSETEKSGGNFVATLSLDHSLAWNIKEATLYFEGNPWGRSAPRDFWENPLKWTVSAEEALRVSSSHAVMVETGTLKITPRDVEFRFFARELHVLHNKPLEVPQGQIWGTQRFSYTQFVPGKEKDSLLVEVGDGKAIVNFKDGESVLGSYTEPQVIHLLALDRAVVLVVIVKREFEEKTGVELIVKQSTDERQWVLTLQSLGLMSSDEVEKARLVLDGGEVTSKTGSGWIVDIGSDWPAKYLCGITMLAGNVKFQPTICFEHSEVGFDAALNKELMVEHDFFSEVSQSSEKYAIGETGDSLVADFAPGCHGLKLTFQDAQTQFLYTADMMVKWQGKNLRVQVPVKVSKKLKASTDGILVLREHSRGEYINQFVVSLKEFSEPSGSIFEATHFYLNGELLRTRTEVPESYRGTQKNSREGWFSWVLKSEEVMGSTWHPDAATVATGIYRIKPRAVRLIFLEWELNVLQQNTLELLEGQFLAGANDTGRYNFHGGSLLAKLRNGKLNVEFEEKKSKFGLLKKLPKELVVMNFHISGNVELEVPVRVVRKFEAQSTWT